MTSTRQAQQVAFDGIRSTWSSSADRTPSAQTTVMTSIDGAARAHEDGKVVHVVRRTVSNATQKKVRQIPVLNVGVEGTMRNIMRDVYTVKLKSLPAQLSLSHMAGAKSSPKYTMRDGGMTVELSQRGRKAISHLMLVGHGA